MNKKIKKGVLKSATAGYKETTEGPVESLTVFKEEKRDEKNWEFSNHCRSSIY